MFNKGNFSGQFRRTPTVSIGGASKSESREEVIRKAQQERSQREAERSKHSAVLHIQAAVRGFLARRRVRRLSRQELERLQQKISKQTSHNVEDYRQLGVALLRSYQRDVDSGVFAWYSQALVKLRQELLPLISSNIQWRHLITRLQTLAIGEEISLDLMSDDCLNFLDYLVYNQENVASSLRFIQVYTDAESYSSAGTLVVSKIFKYLVSNSYFAKVRQLVDTRIPPLLQETTRAPTPVSGEILGMITRPLLMVETCPDNSLVTDVMTQLCKHILAPAFSDQIRLFILPSLCQTKGFPLSRLLNSFSVISREEPQLLTSSGLLFSLLSLSRPHLASLHPSLLTVLASLLTGVLNNSAHREDPEHLEDDEEEDMDDVTMRDTDCLTEQAVAIINEKDFVSFFVRMAEISLRQDCPTFSGVGGGVSSSSIRQLCVICHQLLLHHSQAMYQYSLLYTLAFTPDFLRELWNIITSTAQLSVFSSAPTPLISLLARGIKMSPQERDDILPQLAVFSSLFGYLLVTIHDTEFYSNQAQGKAWMPFSLTELVKMSLHLRDIALGLVELAFPDSRPAVREEYRLAVNSVKSAAVEEEVEDVVMWSHMFRSVVVIVRQLYNRDTRRQYCPSHHWINSKIVLPQDRYQDLSFRRSRLRAYRPFRGLRVFTRDELEEHGPPLSTREVRLATILRELPFTISFSQRVMVFQNLIYKDKHDHQGDQVNFLQGPHINLVVRRNYIYEDSFDKLSKSNEPNLKIKMRVQLVNAVGLDEAGIDGGGLFREFLSQLLKSAFDPNRGFFTLTKDQMLYPNPSADKIHGDSSPHYYFIGRILGKALYENLLVELPLASFFLSKLLGQTLINVDIDHLYSLDPELHKNLLYLKTYEGDVQDLDLDFTIAVDDFGENKVVLLKQDGDEIPVTNENRIEYIHLVADFKLNKQIRQQCNAFRNGLADVIGLDWLRMFSSKELSTLVAGAEHEINVSDLQVDLLPLNSSVFKLIFCLRLTPTTLVATS